MNFLLLGVLLVIISGIHYLQLRSYLRLKHASRELTATLAALNTFITDNPPRSLRLRTLTAIAPYVLPSLVPEALLSISQAIPERTFLTSISLTAHHSLVLTGFSHSKKELRAFTKALTHQTIFPCKTRKTLLSGTVGVTFTIVLRPTLEMLPITRASDVKTFSFQQLLLTTFPYTIPLLFVRK